MFLYPLGNGHNQTGCLKGGGLTQKKKHIFSCKMHFFRTMVVIRFKMWQMPRINFNPRRENRIYLHFGERRSKRRKSQKKEDPGARKGRKVAKHCVFPMICGSGALAATEYICNIKCKITVDKFRSCTYHKQ